MIKKNSLLFTLVVHGFVGWDEREGRGHLNVIHTRVKWYPYPAGLPNELGICDPSYQRSFK